MWCRPVLARLGGSADFLLTFWAPEFSARRRTTSLRSATYVRSPRSWRELVQALPEDQVDVVLDDVRRRLSPPPKSEWLPAWFADRQSSRPEASGGEPNNGQGPGPDCTSDPPDLDQVVLIHASRGVTTPPVPARRAASSPSGSTTRSTTLSPTRRCACWWKRRSNPDSAEASSPSCDLKTSTSAPGSSPCRARW